MKPPPQPEGSPLEKKRATTRRKFATEVYKPSNRLLPPNKRLWASENVNDVSEDTAPSKEIQQVIEQAPPKRVKLKVVEESDSKVKSKAGRKIASKPVKLSDKSNAQKEVITRTGGRVTRSSAMTNSRVGRSKIGVLADQEEEIRPAKAVVKLAGPRLMGGEDADAEQEDHFLDVSADHVIQPSRFRHTKPTQQSLGADVTLTFDMDRHSRALAGCSPIPRIPHHQLGALEEAPSAGEDVDPPPPSTSVVKKTRAKLKIPSQTPADPEPSPPKKRTRRQPATKSSKTKASKGPGSDDPLMI